MITFVDNLLRDLFLSQLPGITDEGQIRFQPPDADWRTYVTNLTVDGQPANALNIYLVDVRENRKFRRNDSIRAVVNGVITEEQVPAKLDCHYLITTWSPAAVSVAVEPALDEHALLFQAITVLMRNIPFTPAKIYPAKSAALKAWPEIYRTQPLPVTVTPMEDFIKPSEFWQSMGEGSRWKPALHMVITVPVEYVAEIAGPMVRTRVIEFRQVDIHETRETWVMIAGHVFDSNKKTDDGEPAPLGGIPLQIEDKDGKVAFTTQSDRFGYYTFSRLEPGAYRIRAKIGRDEKTLDVTAPDARGAYDVFFP